MRGCSETRVVVYEKAGCHLCENVISTLRRINADQHFELSTRDITTDSVVFNRFKDVIPVVEVDGKIRLGGAVLANPRTLEDILRRCLSA